MAARILLVDNRDSFTWNLAHDLERTGAAVRVIQAAECAEEDGDEVDGIVLSPGPGLPSESVGLMDLVEAWAPRRPMLGVCLGLQALVEWSGGKLRQMDTVRHGVPGRAKPLAAESMFEGCGAEFEVGHYHSWCADVDQLPDCWVMTAEAAVPDDGGRTIPLAIRHRTLPLRGVQFHPESVLTPLGRQMLKGWMDTLTP